MELESTGVGDQDAQDHRQPAAADECISEQQLVALHRLLLILLQLGARSIPGAGCSKLSMICTAAERWSSTLDDELCRIRVHVKLMILSEEGRSISSDSLSMHIRCTVCCSRSASVGISISISSYQRSLSKEGRS